jgi:hypothetical protein
VKAKSRKEIQDEQLDELEQRVRR